MDGARLSQAGNRSGLCAAPLPAALSVRADGERSRRLPQPSRRLAADRRREARLRLHLRGRRRDRRPPRSPALIEFVAAERAAWDYVLMPATPIRGGTAVARRGGLALLRPDAPPLRAIAQIVSRAAAERLLDAHPAVRPPGRHAPADDLGHRPAGAGRLALAGPRRLARDRRQHRPAAGRWGSPSASATKRCARSTGRRSWPATGAPCRGPEPG